jgi:uracil-DNA glycosylase
VVVALGSPALRALTGRRDLSLSAVQGQVLEVDGRRIVPTWHPSYVLRLPGREAQDAAFQAMLAALLVAKKLLAENVAQI